MVTVVIGINLLIAVFCLYVAWQVWKLQKILARAADALIVAERSTHAVLAGAPAAIAKGQAGTNSLRQQYHRLELQLLKAQKILALTGLSRFVWQWYTRRSLSHTRQRAKSPRRNKR